MIHGQLGCWFIEEGVLGIPRPQVVLSPSYLSSPNWQGSPWSSRNLPYFSHPMKNIEVRGLPRLWSPLDGTMNPLSHVPLNCASPELHSEPAPHP